MIHVLIFAIYSSLNFVKAQQSGMPSALRRLWEMAFNFVSNIFALLLVDFSCKNLGSLLELSGEEEKVEDS